MNIWQVISSTLLAFLGVQSQQNRRRDFAQGSPIVFIITGIVMAILFVIVLIILVNLVLNYSS
ncbi:DUF2970 domain-containing protein [Shewanella marina]|uniref:DUF2970 domain-containing protein n=1 Tax=Shewanella marina TaxID=487319 RepID=UPI0009FBF209|nr:DUF2970 domain-containing protein [Shewanella marina]